MAEPARYVFQPLEKRGVVLGLGAGQLAGVGAALLGAYCLHAAVGGPAGTLLAVVLVGVGAAASLWTRQSEPVGQWLLRKAAWVVRRPLAPALDPVMVAPAAGRRRPTAPAAIGLAEDVGPGVGPMAVVWDRREGTAAGVIPVDGVSFALLDEASQVGYLEGWRRVLAALGRPGTPVLRIQWVHRTAACGGSAVAGLALPPRPGPAGGGPAGRGSGAGRAAPGYDDFTARAVPGMAGRAGWLVVVTSGRRGRTAAVAALRREIRLLEGQLRAAGLTPGPALDLDGLTRALAAPARPGGAPAARGLRSAVWPLAVDDRWAELRTDGAWHCTYWVAEWPRVPVRPDFLAPLLIGARRASVSVLMAPVDADRALRQARSSRASDLADAELRARAGFLPSSRRRRETEGAQRREEELADGHAEFRFSGYLTVSADDADDLVAACAEAEHAAQAARIELRRLYGRQHEAYYWTQPLGRGLR